jgi:hypothetical protein
MKKYERHIETILAIDARHRINQVNEEEFLVVETNDKLKRTE